MGNQIVINQRQKTFNWQEKNIQNFGIDLSFADVPEWKRTKHVHRLHPYLGKFIPQLVKVFLKKYFKPGQTILDPFLGSGTTLIEANLLGMPSIGIELSEFSHLISRVKIQKYNIELLEKEIIDILNKTNEFSQRIQQNQKSLVEDWDFEPSEYFKIWYHPRAIKEIYFYRNLIQNYQNQDVLKIILSRSARSSRQIPHYDLARPKKPVKERYWCIKHKQYCYPIDNAIKFINRYSWDTIERIKEFDRLKTARRIIILQGDTRIIKLPVKREIDGVFTSPPYLGLINYQDQHRYAYDLFNFKEYQQAEIGSPIRNENWNNKKENYKNDIVAALKNMKKYMKERAKIFIVVNDKHNLYPEIAKECGFKIIDVFHRPVLMRTERDNNRFSENIYYFVNEK